MFNPVYRLFGLRFDASQHKLVENKIFYFPEQILPRLLKVVFCTYLVPILNEKTLTISTILQNLYTAICINGIHTQNFLKHRSILYRTKNTMATVRHKSCISMGRNFNNILKYNVLNSNFSSYLKLLRAQSSTLVKEDRLQNVNGSSPFSLISICALKDSFLKGDSPLRRYRSCFVKTLVRHLD